MPESRHTDRLLRESVALFTYNPAFYPRLRPDTLRLDSNELSVKPPAKVILILAGLLVVAAAAVIAGHLWLNAVIKQALEQVGSKMTRSTVTVEDVEASVIGGRVRIDGLVIANPPGFRKPTAMKAGKTMIHFNWMTVFSDPLVIDEIIVSDPEFAYEGRLGRNNMNAIQERIETLAYTGPKETDASLPGLREAGLDKKVVIRKFSLTNGRVTWQGKDRSMISTLPDIRLSNIAEKSGGAGIQEIASAIYNDITRTVTGTDKAMEKDRNGSE